MAPAAISDRIALGERHVAEGLAGIDRQVLLIASMAKSGRDTKQACAILETFLVVQDQYEADLERLRAMA